MLIGIGGCSRSGKSSLATELVWYFRCQNKTVYAIHQDDFVRRIGDMPLINNATDWDTPLSIDFDLLLDIVKLFQSKFEVVIVEGLYAFYDARLAYTHKLYTEISEGSFKQRRRLETRWGIEPEWFIDHVWQRFLEFGKPKTNDKLLKISGEKAFELEKVVAYLGQE